MDPGQERQGLNELCCSSWGQVRGFIQPCLLLLVRQKPSHGYELMDRLRQEEDDPDADPALIYRTLRQLEEYGMVSSVWDTAGRGPARRLYQITPLGEVHLHAWAANIRRMQRRLGRFLAEYDGIFLENEERVTRKEISDESKILVV